jgi:prepilin-type N-terminal cleavage/methylation domain-containing protein
MKKGFTLVELSIVLIIIGLLTGGAFQMLQVMNEKARATEAKENLESVKKAIITFAVNNSRLPTQAEFSAMNLTGAGNIALFYNSDTPLQTSLCSVQSTPLQTTNPNGVTTQNIGFVLAAAGENFNIQTGRIGDTVTFHPWNTPNIDDETAVLDRPEPYDDFYLQVTLGELQATAECKPLSIITPMLPTGVVNTPYLVNPAITAIGGSPNYTYLRSGTLPTGIQYANNAFSGTPTQSGSFPLNFTVTDSAAQSVTQTLVLIINADPTAGTGGSGGGSGGSGGGNSNNNGQGIGVGGTPPGQANN